MAPGKAQDGPRGHAHSRHDGRNSADWALPGGMTDEETLEAEEARDKIIVTEFMWLVRLASELRTAWQDAAAPRVQWRDRRKASRGQHRILDRMAATERGRTRATVRAPPVRWMSPMVVRTQSGARRAPPPLA